MMRATRLGLLGLVVLLVLSAGRAGAAVYPDTANDAFEGGANPHLEITSVEVSNDASNITFKVNLAGDIVATNWGKYLIGIDSVPGGITTGNAWSRPIAMSAGMDFFIGSWVDFGTGWEIHRDAGGTWVRDHATYDAVNPLAPSVVTPNSVAFTIPLAYLNLADGNSFKFDVYSSGGGGTDSANDASSNPSQSVTGWAGPYDSGALVSSFTVIVPEPASIGVIGLAGLAMCLRRRK